MGNSLRGLRSGTTNLSGSEHLATSGRKVDHPMRGLDTTAKSNQCWNESWSFGKTRRTQKNAAMRKRLDPNLVCRSKQRGNSKGSECGRRKKKAFDERPGYDSKEQSML